MKFIALILCIGSAARAAAPSLEVGRGHWAFQPLGDDALPSVKSADWPLDDLDRYVLAAMESAGAKPSEEASRAVLLRRVTLDLIGLLPSPEEVQAFENDASPEAYERVVDRLLASSHYGERWGRHWLDLARYADSSGFHNDLDRPFAWKYRDYVIRSFNDNKPYARFVAEQIAGDEIEGADESSLIATGFCRHGPSNDDNMGKTPENIAQYRADRLDDVISTTSSVFLGLTLGCARCHDHKTEPLLAKDYYSLMAIFNGTQRVGLPAGATDDNDKKVKDTAKFMALIETQPQVPPMHVMLRGMAASPGERVEPAIPVVLGAKGIAFPPPAAKSSLRRRTLADWITSSSNPLTWRVIANRVWQHHFGTGLVSTPSNFGLSGERPAQPALLDHLAQRLLASGGKLKALHKIILMSATYRQASTSESNPALRPLRPALQRMEAEVLRDCLLAASGKLNVKAGGPGFKPRIRPELLDTSQRNKWPSIAKEGPEHWRRSIYIYSKRQLLVPSLELFDAPTTIDSCALRTQSTVPTQALVLMNDEFVETQAGHLARRALAEAKDERGAIRQMFRITLGRWPTNERLAEAQAFVAERGEGGLADLAHVLFNSSEFVFIE